MNLNIKTNVTNTIWEVVRVGGGDDGGTYFTACSCYIAGY